MKHYYAGMLFTGIYSFSKLLDKKCLLVFLGLDKTNKLNLINVFVYSNKSLYAEGM